MEQAVSDAVLVTAAARQARMVRTDKWPIVAAHLVALGLDGDALIELAGLSSSASGWQIDQLVEAVRVELGMAVLDDLALGEVLVRLVAASSLEGEFRTVRVLAPLAPQMDYPKGRIGEAYRHDEYIDCSCHPAEKQAAREWEELMAQEPALAVPRELADALLGLA